MRKGRKDPITTHPAAYVGGLCARGPESALRADGIVGAQRAGAQLVREMVFDVASLLHEAAQGALGVGMPV